MNKKTTTNILFTDDELLQIINLASIKERLYLVNEEKLQTDKDSSKDTGMVTLGVMELYFQIFSHVIVHDNLPLLIVWLKSQKNLDKTMQSGLVEVLESLLNIKHLPPIFYHKDI